MAIQPFSEEYDRLQYEKLAPQIEAEIDRMFEGRGATSSFREQIKTDRLSKLKTEIMLSSAAKQFEQQEQMRREGAASAEREKDRQERQGRENSARTAELDAENRARAEYDRRLLDARALRSERRTQALDDENRKWYRELQEKYGYTEPEALAIVQQEQPDFEVGTEDERRRRSKSPAGSNPNTPPLFGGQQGFAPFLRPGTAFTPRTGFSASSSRGGATGGGGIAGFFSQPSGAYDPREAEKTGYYVAGGAALRWDPLSKTFKDDRGQSRTPTGWMEKDQSGKLIDHTIDPATYRPGSARTIDSGGTNTDSKSFNERETEEQRIAREKKEKESSGDSGSGGSDRRPADPSDPVYAAPSLAAAPALAPALAGAPGLGSGVFRPGNDKPVFAAPGMNPAPVMGAGGFRSFASSKRPELTPSLRGSSMQSFGQQPVESGTFKDMFKSATDGGPSGRELPFDFGGGQRAGLPGGDVPAFGSTGFRKLVPANPYDVRKRAA